MATVTMATIFYGKITLDFLEAGVRIVVPAILLFGVLAGVLPNCRSFCTCSSFWRCLFSFCMSFLACS